MSTDESSDLADRLRALPPDLPHPADRVALVGARARRRHVRRRALAVGATALVAAAAVVVPAVVQQGGTTAGPGPVADDPTSSESPLEPPADFLDHGQTLPGGTVLEPLSEPLTSIHDGAAVVDLGPRPAGATAVEIIVECLSPGQVTYPTGASSGCSASEISSEPRSRSAWDTVPLEDGQDQLRFPRGTMRWRLVTRYVATRVLPLGVNANGDTYGTGSGDLQPDLIGVIATNGRSGYAYQSDFEAADPMPRTPAEAAALDPDRGPFMIPVYESDGETRIGEYQYGG